MLLKVLGFILVHLLLAIYEKFMSTMSDRIDKNKQQQSLKARKIEIHDKIRFIFRIVILIVISCYDIFLMWPYITYQDRQVGLFFSFVFASFIIIIAFIVAEFVRVAFVLLIKMNELLTKNLIGKFYEDFLVDYINKKDSKKQEENKAVKTNNNSSLV